MQRLSQYTRSYVNLFCVFLNIVSIVFTFALLLCVMQEKVLSDNWKTIFLEAYGTQFRKIRVAENYCIWKYFPRGIIELLYDSRYWTNDTRTLLIW